MVLPGRTRSSTWRAPLETLRFPEILAFALVLLGSALGPAAAEAADGSAAEPVAKRAVTEEGIHVGVRIAPPISGLGTEGVTLYGGALTLRSGIWAVEVDHFHGTELEASGDGNFTSARIGAILGVYGTAGAARLALTAGYAHAQFDRNHDIREVADLHGLGGEVSAGYVAPFGLEVRLTYAQYGVVGGEERFDEPQWGHEQTALIHVGATVGWEF